MSSKQEITPHTLCRLLINIIVCICHKNPDSPKGEMVDLIRFTGVEIVPWGLDTLKHDLVVQLYLHSKHITWYKYLVYTHTYITQHRVISQAVAKLHNTP